MGSFNTSCCVSHQTISSNDKAVLIPIVQQKSYSKVNLIDSNNINHSLYSYTDSTCYCESFWKPYSTHLEVIYDDYGQVDIIENEYNVKSLNILFSYLYDNSLITQLGENEYHDLSFNIRLKYEKDKEYTFEELVGVYKYLEEVTNEYRVFINSNKSISPIAFSIVSIHTYNYLTNSHSEYTDYENNLVTKKSQIAKHYNNIKEYSNTLSIFYMSNLLQLSDMYIGREGTPKTAYSKLIDYDNIKNIIYCDEEEIEIIDKLYKEFEKILDFRYFINGLNIINCKLIPMYYASQDYNNSIGDMYLDMLNNVNQLINKDKKSDDE